MYQKKRDALDSFSKTVNVIGGFCTLTRKLAKLIWPQSVCVQARNH